VWRLAAVRSTARFYEPLLNAALQINHLGSFMDRKLFRTYLVELIGTFALVYVAAGMVCVNHMTTPRDTEMRTATLGRDQPGLVGMALAQGLILAIMLAATVPISGGYLNPAITIMLWVFNKLDSVKMAWYIGAQFVGAVVAGLCLRYTFDTNILEGARLGTPHLNPLVYPGPLTRPLLLAGTGIELILTFFLVFAIFSVGAANGRARLAAWSAGAALAVGVLVGFALTGAALNPARWFGPALWELAMVEQTVGPGAMADVFVYIAGPILGALVGGLVCFKILPQAKEESAQPTAVAEPASSRAKK
jgi:glycerol uptake facilitator-like aquaporin